MQIHTLTLLVALAATVRGAAVPVALVDAQITEPPSLEKRAKEVVMNKDYKNLQKELSGRSSSSERPKPWVRTIYSTQVEIVTPTVVAGVTISAKPATTTDGMEPWVSLNKDGSPKTIKPQIKNGIIKNGSPTYGTYFQTPVTKTYNKEELKAHNMADDQIHEEVEWIPEDNTYHALNPILRCTPKYYQNKGMLKDRSPEPFCYPRDDAALKLDKTYFVTWYYPFFDKAVEKVKLRFFYVKETAKEKGMKKRALEFLDSGMDLVKRSRVLEKGGAPHRQSFFDSEWVPKDAGMLPITVEDSWIGKNQEYRKVLMALQPDNVEDKEFDFLKNSIVVEFRRGAKVGKEHLQDLKKQEEKNRLKAIYGEGYEVEEGIDYEKYIIMMSVPTCVVLAGLGMYLFVLVNKKHTDVSFLRKVKFNRKKHHKLPFKRKETKYSELPQWDGPKAD